MHSRAVEGASIRSPIPLARPCAILNRCAAMTPRMEMLYYTIDAGRLAGLPGPAYMIPQGMSAEAAVRKTRARAGKAYGTLRGVIEPDQEELLRWYERRLSGR